MNFSQFCSSDNLNSLLWGCYSFGLWYLLALKSTIRIIGRDDMVGIKLEWVGGWKNFRKINNVVNVSNDMKDFCCLDLKHSMFCLQHFVRFVHFFFIEESIFIECVWIYIPPSSRPSQASINAIGNTHNVRFCNIYIPSHIVYYIFPIPIIVLAIKALGFSEVRLTLSNTFAIHYGDIND